MNEENVKVDGVGVVEGPGGRPSSAAGVRQPVLAQRLHLAATRRVSDPTAFLADRLPWRGGAGLGVERPLTHL